MVGTAGLALVVACGDGTTEPPPPPPPPIPSRATTVDVRPAEVELTALGETARFSAQVLDQNGQAMGAAVAWSSGDSLVATVDASGLAAAAGNGMATITATSGSASGNAAVTVAQAVSAVVVSPSADTLVAGDTLRLAAAATDANGHAAEVEVYWASGDTAVAVVDASGLVTGVGAGETDVTATGAGVTGRATLVVAAAPPETVAVTPDTVSLVAPGVTVRLMAEVRDRFGRTIEGEAVAWASGDTLVARVDTAGLVTAMGRGTTTVTAMAGSASGSAAVAVLRSVTSVAVAPVADTIAPRDTLRLAATAFDENGAVPAAEFSWSSSDPSVATVDTTGLVRGVGAGVATIHATSGPARGGAEIAVVNSERAVLAALYEDTDGRNWTNNRGWLTGAPLD